MRNRRLLSVLVSCVAAPAVLALIGCEVDSADSLTRAVGEFLISGVYYGQFNGRVTDRQTGHPVGRLDVRQSGDQLEAIDNHDYVFTGTIGSESDTVGYFILRGRTTVGSEVTISGTIEKSGSTATMRGSWIEPTIYGAVYAIATGVATNPVGTAYTLTVNISGSGTVSKNPDQTTYTEGTSVTLTATPSTGHTFTAWSGDLSGSSNPATITMNGNKTVTATFN